uniref:Uncharacterized protein n=1 Tax=Meloidogyne hapla TaxID=6305 RepID=A0A1I8AXU1_MELHA
MLELNNKTTKIPKQQLNNSKKGSRTWSINKSTNINLFNKQPPIITNLLDILNNKNEKQYLSNISGPYVNIPQKTILTTTTFQSNISPIISNIPEAEEFADEDKEEKQKLKINKYIPEEYLEQNELENWLDKRLKDKNINYSNDYYDEIKNEKNKQNSIEDIEILNDDNINDENEQKRRTKKEKAKNEEINFSINPSIDNCMEYLIRNLDN